jgi:hypothetical protein
LRNQISVLSLALPRGIETTVFAVRGPLQRPAVSFYVC